MGQNGRYKGVILVGLKEWKWTVEMTESGRLPKVNGPEINDTSSGIVHFEPEGEERPFWTFLEGPFTLAEFLMTVHFWPSSEDRSLWTFYKWPSTLDMRSMIVHFRTQKCLPLVFESLIQ